MTIDFFEYVEDNTINLSNKIDCSKTNIEGLRNFLAINPDIIHINLSNCNLKFVMFHDSFIKGTYGREATHKIFYFNPGSTLNLSNNFELNLSVIARCIDDFDYLHNLTVLNVSNCMLNNLDLSMFISKMEGLKRMTQQEIKLEELDVSHNNLNNEVVEKFIKYFSTSDLIFTLKKINFSYNKFTYEGLKSLFTALNHISNKIEEINFEGHNLDSFQFNELQDIVPTNSHFVSTSWISDEAKTTEYNVIVKQKIDVTRKEEQISSEHTNYDLAEANNQSVSAPNICDFDSTNKQIILEKKDWEEKGIDNFSTGPLSFIHYISEDTIDCSQAGITNLLEMNLLELSNFMFYTNKIKHINLSNCNIHASSLYNLQGDKLINIITFKGLESLNLSNNNFGLFSRYIHNLNLGINVLETEIDLAMKSINLSNCKINFNVFQTALNSLGMKFPNLEYLNISNNKLDSQYVMNDLCQIINYGLLNHCAELDISGNDISFEAIKCLMNTIKNSNCPIKLLNFSNTLINSDQENTLNLLFATVNNKGNTMDVDNNDNQGPEEHNIGSSTSTKINVHTIYDDQSLIVAESQPKKIKTNDLASFNFFNSSVNNTDSTNTEFFITKPIASEDQILRIKILASDPTHQNLGVLDSILRLYNFTTEQNASIVDYINEVKPFILEEDFTIINSIMLSLGVTKETMETN